MNKEWDGEGMSEFPRRAKPEWPKTVRLARVYELTFVDEADFKKVVEDGWSGAAYDTPDENTPADKLDENGRLLEPDEGSYDIFRNDYKGMEDVDKFELPINTVEKYVQLTKHDIEIGNISADDVFSDYVETWEIV